MQRGRWLSGDIHGPWHGLRGVRSTVVIEGARLHGYRLVGVRTWPNQVHLILEQPAGMTPIRIKLVGPAELIPEDAPQIGELVEASEWQAGNSGNESLTLNFVSGPPLQASCQQVIVDVF
jgi:hypothetical protein